LWGVITAPCRKFWEDYGLTGISYQKTCAAKSRDPCKPV
jgi:hypothetical protein